LGAGGVVPAGGRIEGRQKEAPELQEGYDEPLYQGANLFLPFLLLRAIIFLPERDLMRARNPLLRFFFFMDMWGFRPSVTIPITP